MYLTRDGLNKVILKNVMNSKVNELQIRTLGYVVDNMGFNEIALQVVKNGKLIKELSNDKVECFLPDYIFYDKDGFLKGIECEDGHKSKISIYNDSRMEARFVILNLDQEW